MALEREKGKQVPIRGIYFQNQPFLQKKISHDSRKTQDSFHRSHIHWDKFLYI